MGGGGEATGRISRSRPNPSPSPLPRPSLLLLFAGSPDLGLATDSLSRESDACHRTLGEKISNFTASLSRHVSVIAQVFFFLLQLGKILHAYIMECTNHSTFLCSMCSVSFQMRSCLAMFLFCQLQSIGMDICLHKSCLSILPD